MLYTIIIALVKIHYSYNIGLHNALKYVEQLVLFLLRALNWTDCFKLIILPPFQFIFLLMQILFK